MQKLLQALVWPLTTAGCVAALLLTHALKWPRSKDAMNALRQEAAVVAAALPPDSPLALRVVGLPEDYFNHLRYAMIPRPLERSMWRAKRVLLLTADSTAEAAETRLLYERPDLRRIYSRQGTGFRLAFYKPGTG